MSSSSSEEGDIFDEHCFRSLYNQKLFEETVSMKEIIPERGFDCDEEYPEVKEQIYKREWRRLVSPRTEVSKNMIHEFYANANRSKEEMEELQVHPYISRVRGVEIDFSLANLARVMRFKEEIPGAENSFENRQNGDQQLDAVIRDLCIQGASWKMGTGRNAKPIQLRRQELRPLARGWEELIIHNIIPTGNKSEITVARAVLIHSIIQGDDVRAENRIANNMVIIAQPIEGKGLLGFPSTIYKPCKDAGVRMREFKRTEQVPEERYITAKVNRTMEEHHNEMIMIKRQLKEWARNATYRDAYCCWAHQQSNSNLTATYEIPELMKENAEKGRNIFYGLLKSDPGAGSSSQAAPAPPPQEDEQIAEPDS
ncbi:hypothetical protein PIB30_081356 [Stylosanthes scabra]|uniref:Putative plant transposon protein domain-containing protein n=1 Tax=Stylosanthes scabra TaxID=79078 RepID=A0ABU6TT31_9FABA|nr:hypothetical protein [Stylosanthes scabra]